MNVYRKALCAFGAGAILSLFAAMPTHAAVILGTEQEGTGGYGLGYSFSEDTNLTVGQSFTLNQPVDLSAITVFVNGDDTADPQPSFTLYLTEAIGSAATAADVLFSSNANFPSGFPDEHPAVTFPTSVSLSAGTYYIVLSSGVVEEGGTGTGWGSGGEILPSTYGTVGDAYVGITTAQGDYTSLDPENPSAGDHANFQLSIVPEPTAATLLVPAALLMIRRRRGRCAPGEG